MTGAKSGTKSSKSHPKKLMVLTKSQGRSSQSGSYYNKQGLCSKPLIKRTENSVYACANPSNWGLPCSGCSTPRKSAKPIMVVRKTGG
jgi:hypothetical protein